MAFGSLLALLDDIASILDDVSVMTKTAASKTAGVLGDDLALNAQQVSGVVAKRELPVVWAVAKGSLINKLILVPVALAISAMAPWAITPLLMVGGTYLCFEGAEKLFHHVFHRRKKGQVQAVEEIAALKECSETETAKVKGAIRTDFVLSAEIIAITLGIVADVSFATQLLVLSIIAVVMTGGVYGLVAGIVKLDDLGLYLSQRNGRTNQSIGRGILWFAPFLMKGLSIVGTAAMFLVGGGIIAHGLPWLHHSIEGMVHKVGEIQDIGSFLSALSEAILNGVAGLATGAITVFVVSGIQKLRGKSH